MLFCSKGSQWPFRWGILLQCLVPFPLPTSHSWMRMTALWIRIVTLMHALIVVIVIIIIIIIITIKLIIHIITWDQTCPDTIAQPCSGQYISSPHHCRLIKAIWCLVECPPRLFFGVENGQQHLTYCCWPPFGNSSCKATPMLPLQC